jgi:hypothetical protein
MGRGKKYQPEQVVNLLRQIEVAVANGKTTAQMHSSRRSSSLPASTAVMAIAGSRRCSSERAGGWVRIAWSASGVAKG